MTDMTGMARIVYALVFLLHIGGAFQQRTGCRIPTQRMRASDDDGESTTVTQETSAPLKAVWAGTELFGKLAAGVTGPAASADSDEADQPPPSTADEAVQRLREDYERDYFVTGQIDRELYAVDWYVVSCRPSVRPS